MRLETQPFPNPNTETTTPVVQTQKNPDLDTIAQDIHQKINQYRQSQNLSPLQLDPTITQQAQLHSQAMATGEVPFSHQGFEKRADTISKAVQYRSVAENVAYNQGYSDPAENAVSGWLQSPGHYKNIVGDFDLTGIGVAKNEAGEYYFTQIFAKQR
jgi:uncharacterized protein YkwD